MSETIYTVLLGIRAALLIIIAVVMVIRVGLRVSDGRARRKN